MFQISRCESVLYTKQYKVEFKNALRKKKKKKKKKNRKEIKQNKHEL